MSLNFRELMEKDIPKVLSLFSKLSKEMEEVSFTDIATEDQILDWLDNEDTYVYVAADGDLILAVIRAKRSRGHKDHSAMLTVAVDYNFRGQSIARELTNYCTTRLKEVGVKIVRAYIYSNNPSSISTILSCGFTLTGNVHMHHYDEVSESYVDDIIFHKIL